jgi:hypothetical protein
VAPRVGEAGVSQVWREAQTALAAGHVRMHQVHRRRNAQPEKVDDCALMRLVSLRIPPPVFNSMRKKNHGIQHSLQCAFHVFNSMRKKIHGTQHSLFSTHSGYICVVSETIRPESSNFYVHAMCVIQFALELRNGGSD